MEIGEEILAGFESRGLTELHPAERCDYGDGPHQQLILRGATLIDGTGAPPWGYVDIVIERDRIKEIVSGNSATDHGSRHSGLLRFFPRPTRHPAAHASPQHCRDLLLESLGAENIVAVGRLADFIH